MRIARAALGAAVIGSLLILGGSAAFGASPSAGGPIKVWVTPSATGSGGSIIITGVVGDYGTTSNVNAAGKPDQKGQYKLLILKKGTMLVNGTQLNTATNNFNPTNFNQATCSASASFSAPVQIVSGTKAYAGITGTVTMTATFAFVGPFYKSGTKKGQCNTSNNAPQPPGFFATITGSGSVSFA